MPDPAAQPRKWRRGDVGPDGRVFWRYASRTRSEEWLDAGVFERRKKDASRKIVAYMRRRFAEDPALKERVTRQNTARASFRRLHDPSFKKQRYATVRAWQLRPDIQERRRRRDRERMRNDARHAAAVRLRQRIRALVRRGARVSRKGDGAHEGAAFLSWCIKRLGLTLSPKLHVEHLWPLSRWNEAPAGVRPNGPENVRWLGAQENWQKRTTLPTPEEVAAHLALVEEWKKETQSQKSA